MTTTANNNFHQGILQGEVELPFSTSNSSATAIINAGDIVWFDYAQTQGFGRIVSSITTDAQAASSVGVSQMSVPINSIAPTQDPTPNYIVINFNAIFRMNSTTGDTYNWFDALYIGADAQTLTNTAGGKTNVLGRIYFPPSNANGVVINPVNFAGGSGIQIYAIIKPLFTLLGIL